MRRRSAAILLLAALLMGCGGEEETPKRTATVPAGGSVRVVADEYSFDPGNLVTAARGGRGRVRVQLVNKGSLAHNLRVERDGRELGGTATLEGGETRSSRLELPAGSYRIVCTVGDHEQLGMVGTLAVR